MATGNGKRQRRLPPLDSEAGRISVEQTRAFLTEHFGDAFTRPDFVEMPAEHLAWSAALPGFPEARGSAFDAWLQSEAELGYWREMAAATDRAAREEIIARHQTSLGIGSPEAISAELLKHVPPARAYRILADASKNAESNQPPPPLAYDVVSHAQPKSSSDSVTPEEWADMWTLLAGRRSSTMRRLFVMCWIHGGLWLAETPDAAAFLTTRRQLLPEFASLSAPTAETLRVWKNELGLCSYAGKGRLCFDQVGNPRLDPVLRAEARSALDALKMMIAEMNKHT